MEKYNEMRVVALYKRKGLLRLVVSRNTPNEKALRLEQEGFKLVSCCITNIIDVYRKNLVKAETLILKNMIKRGNAYLAQANIKDRETKVVANYIKEGIRTQRTQVARSYKALQDRGISYDDSLAKECFYEYANRMNPNFK